MSFSQKKDCTKNAVRDVFLLLLPLRHCISLQSAKFDTGLDVRQQRSVFVCVCILHATISERKMMEHSAAKKGRAIPQNCRMGIKFVSPTHLVARVTGGALTKSGVLKCR